MAEIIAMTRSNYFAVTDADALVKLLTQTKSDTGENPRLICMNDPETKYGFYFSGELKGCLTEEAETKLKSDPDWADDNPDEAYNEYLFYDMLQNLIAPGDACVMISAGHEGAREVWGDAQVITSTGQKHINLLTAAVNAARDMLNRPDWSTRTGY